MISLELPSTLNGFAYHPNGWINCIGLFHSNSDFITREMMQLEQPIYKLPVTLNILEVSNNYDVMTIASIDQGNPLKGVIKLETLEQDVFTVYSLKGTPLFEFARQFNALIPMMSANTEYIISNLTSRINELTNCLQHLKSTGQVTCLTYGNYE